MCRAPLFMAHSNNKNMGTPVSRRRFWFLSLHAHQLEIAISCILYLLTNERETSLNKI
jgi:hypothetical protein